MIIDCHCHAGKGDGLTGPWDTNAPLRDFLRWSRTAGIDRTVLFPAFHSDYAHANRQVARIVASRPDRFYGFAFIHPARDRGRVAAMVREAVVKHGFVGIKVHRYDARITREICEAARDYSLPVLYDVMGEVSVVELLATEYPDRSVHHSAPRQLRRRLEGATCANRPSRAASQCLRRHLGRAALRSPRASRASGGRRQNTFRLRWAMAASRSRARKGERTRSLTDR